jgi:hypothetical protein
MIRIGLSAELGGTMTIFMFIVLCSGCAALGAFVGRAAQQTPVESFEKARLARMRREKAAFQISVKQLEAFHAS